MTRVKRGVTVHRRHHKVLKAAKGFRAGNSKLFTAAKTAVIKSGKHAYVDRKKKKRDFRRLWIARINAACRAMGTKYSLLIDACFKKGIEVNRKMMADMAATEPEVFKAFVEEAMGKR